MKVVYFTHSLVSCWNHGNAHFLRGVLRELMARGCEVSIYEPSDAWSLVNLLTDHGEAGLAPFRAAYPELKSTVYGPDFMLDEALDGADLVLVHEWNSPELIAAVGRMRARGGGFRLLFHDTHHRAVSDPKAIAAMELDAYDGVLAFGETLADVYRRHGWDRRVWVWHEAADVRLFHSPAVEQTRSGLVWIGNWGDDERTDELNCFLLKPAEALELSLDVYGVRYPDKGRAMLQRHNAVYHGWLANVRAPEVFARHLATVHVPRRFYVERLPGIPTIRVFEALACGIPLVSAPWSDSENLFRVGEDFLMADSGKAMRHALREVTQDAGRREALVRSGLETILARHTCGHRADELLAIAAELATAQPALEPAQ